MNRIKNSALPFLFGLAAFAAAATILHMMLPPPLSLHAEYRKEKLGLIERDKNTATVTAFGTSRIHEGFMPDVFDDAAGMQSKSLNLALVAGSHTEQRAMAKEYLRRATVQSSGTCLLLLEWNAGVNLPPEQRFDPRAVNIYDFDTLRFVARFDEPHLSLPRRLGRLGFALLSAAAHYANSGMLSSIWFPSPTDAARSDPRGHVRLEQTEDEARHVADAFAIRPAETRTTEGEIAPGLRMLAEEIATMPEARRFQVAYVMTPKLDDMAAAAKYPETIETEAGPVPIFDLADPALVPELYRPEHWRNTAHLSKSGSALFTRLLAKRVNAWVSAHPRKCEG